MVRPSLGFFLHYVIAFAFEVWNAERRIQGQLDVDINENGMRQAEALAKALEELGILRTVDVVASSDLLRASRTADIIAKACRTAPRRATDPQLREIGYGELQGAQSDTEKCRETQRQGS